MWRATLINGDYETPLMFARYGDMADFVNACFTTDEYNHIRVVIDVVEEEGEGNVQDRYDTDGIWDDDCR